MDVQKLVTMRIPIESGRDVLARVGLRFLFCTGPYFVLAMLMSVFRDSRMLNSWAAIWILAIPFVGGIIDWRRLSNQTRPEQLDNTIAVQ